MDRVPRRFNVLHHAGVKFGRVLLNLHMVVLRQRGMGVAPHEHHQLSMAATLVLEPGDLRILARTTAATEEEGRAPRDPV